MLNSLLFSSLPSNRLCLARVTGEAEVSLVATGDCCAPSPSGSGEDAHTGDVSATVSGISPVVSQPERSCSDTSEVSTAQSLLSPAQHRHSDEQREMFSVAEKGTNTAGDVIILAR